ncbi:SDR family oxidoreductase [Nonomuraea sp. NN258]|uniref:SDR family NAD(P)-dependent oxidoreductase n=1 Tax=Nonomuraea antri TaxID=2730852 RepID=UPI001569871F|nr:SDR family oxidoreductase [Nonomuraea antri]NRQ31141.1 SDR family oxidoreductase [Nonomuraea antri]
MRLKGKVALITGGGTGIGAATARRFVAEGASVLLTGRRAGPLEEVAAGLGPAAAVVAADMADGAQARHAVETCVERFGSLDVVIANAGGHGGGAVAETDDESWRLSLDANLNTCFVTCRETLPALVDSGGSIVVVSSIAGLAAGPAVSGYVTTKHALVGLTRSIARDYGPRVRANCLCPGWVRTPMADEQMEALMERDGITVEEAYARVTQDVPLRRPGTAAEIAGICLFLASDESSLMTGAVVVADGGATAVDLPTLAFT